MKTSTKVISFLLAAGLPGVAFAGIAAASAPALVTTQNLFSIYVAAFIGLTLVQDYSHGGRRVSPAPAPVIVPPAAAFAAAPADRDRLAA